MFNISVSSVIKTEKGSTTTMTVTETMEADSTSGKTNIWKKLYELWTQVKNMHLDICQKWNVLA